jgi:hypothetical protein
MIARVHLALRGSGSVTFDSDALAVVYRVDDQGGLSVQGRYAIPVHDRYDGRPNELLRWFSLELPPGRYAVEACTPSRKLSSGIFELDREGGGYVRLPFEEESPHEWLGWEHFAGVVPDRGRYLDLIGKAHAQEREVVIHNQSDWDWWIGDPFLRLVAVIAKRNGAVPSRAKGLTPNFDDGFTAKYLLDSGEADHGLTFGSVSSGFATSVFRLPFSDEPEPMTGELAVHRSPGSRSLKVWVTRTDPLVASALAYFTSGATDVATLVLSQNAKHIERSFERTSPISLCGILYMDLLLRSEDRWRRRFLLEYLMERHAALADVHILSAWHRLADGRDDEEALAAIKQALHAGYRAGLPFFTYGVRLMVDGLTLFAEEPPLAMVLEHVRRVSRRVDFGQPFTTIRLESDSSPAVQEGPSQ